MFVTMYAIMLCLVPIGAILFWVYIAMLHWQYERGEHLEEGVDIKNYG